MTKHPPRRLNLSFLAGLLGLAIAISLVSAARAAPCEVLSDGAVRYTVCTFDVTKVRLRLFWAGSDGKPFETFSALAEALKERNERLAFAMNAGMFHPDFRPVGLYIEDGRQIAAANTKSGPGNFHLKPNGVFFFDGHRAGVMETQAFLRSGLRPEYATQSGPLLVQDGVFHPKIEPTGTSEKIRNGVGVRDGHVVVFAISDQPVTFYRFASLFRDRLACPDALFLDGSISSLFAPSLDRADGLLPLGPMVGVVEQAR
jgi:uncharacterized protein YigE (DUF2233 family)